MEQVNVQPKKPNRGIKSIIETIWAIGTSVAATGVLYMTSEKSFVSYGES